MEENIRDGARGGFINQFVTKASTKRLFLFLNLLQHHGLVRL